MSLFGMSLLWMITLLSSRCSPQRDRHLQIIVGVYADGRCTQRRRRLDGPLFLTLLDPYPRLSNARSYPSRKWSIFNLSVVREPPPFSPVWFSSEAGTNVLIDSVLLSSLEKWNLRDCGVSACQPSSCCFDDLPVY